MSSRNFLCDALVLSNNRIVMRLVSLAYLLVVTCAVSLDQPDSSDIKPTATKGMVIDAGSGGSRLHVYNWQPRVFKTIPPAISYPTSDERWTARMSPGIADFADNPIDVKRQLAPLIDFAIQTLVGHEENFPNYPIYFKATGGMRELPTAKREELMTWIRFYLSDKTFCPFFFRPDFARVISGEEEAVFSWTCINFLMGNLLPASMGVGLANGGAFTYGTLDLGGASSQISFFIKSQDILEGLYNIQIGSQKHWNVYAKSFLAFGHVSARTRHLSGVADEAIDRRSRGSAEMPRALDYCFHAGYSELVQGTNSSTLVEVAGPPVAAQDQFERCLAALRPLLHKEEGMLCTEVYGPDCSIDGKYQPPLPDDGRFIGTSSYTYPWKMLLLPNKADLRTFKERATQVCSKNFSKLVDYYTSNNMASLDEKLGEFLPYFCFLTSYTYVLLTEGHGFSTNSTITVLDTVNGNKVSWTLGAIMYEINSLPWELEVVPLKEPWGNYLLAALIGMLLGSVGAYYLAKELLRDEHGIHKSESGHYYYISPHASGKGDDVTHILELDSEGNLHEVPHHNNNDHMHGSHSFNGSSRTPNRFFGSHDSETHRDLLHTHSYHSGAYPFSLLAYMDRPLPAEVEMTEPQSESEPLGTAAAAGGAGGGHQSPGRVNNRSSNSSSRSLNADEDGDKTPPRVHSTRPHSFVSPARRWNAHISQYNPFVKSYVEIPDTIKEIGSTNKKKQTKKKSSTGTGNSNGSEV